MAGTTSGAGSIVKTDIEFVEVGVGHAEVNLGDLAFLGINTACRSFDYGTAVEVEGHFVVEARSP